MYVCMYVGMHSKSFHSVHGLHAPSEKTAHRHFVCVAWRGRLFSFRFVSRLALPRKLRIGRNPRGRRVRVRSRCSFVRCFVRSFHTLDTPRQVPALAPVSCRHADRGDRSEGRRSHPPQDLHAVIAKEVVGFVVVVVVVVALAVALGSAFFSSGVFSLFFVVFFLPAARTGGGCSRIPP